MTAPILRRRCDLRKLQSDWQRAGETVAVVPTMGALHEGHLSLVQAAQDVCDRVVVTIFVNPRQFNSPEDLANYPRTEQEDAVKLAGHRVDVIYVPDPDQMYPQGYVTSVSLTGISDVMEGKYRSGHFDGVATVCAKLFLQIGAQKAFFGEKDFQQLLIVRRMAADLDIPIEVIGCPTVREPSGLAMSSRNQRLSERGLEQSACLFSVMNDVSKQLRAGGAFGDLATRARAELLAGGFREIEYFDLRDETTLESTDRGAARLFAAVWMEGVRLIDNIPVKLSDS